MNNNESQSLENTTDYILGTKSIEKSLDNKDLAAAFGEIHKYFEENKYKQLTVSSLMMNQDLSDEQKIIELESLYYQSQEAVPNVQQETVNSVKGILM